MPTIARIDISHHRLPLDPPFVVERPDENCNCVVIAGPLRVVLERMEWDGPSSAFR